MSISGGEFNTVGGCKVEDSAGGMSLSGGHHNKLIGNDIFDVSGSHITTAGNDGDNLMNLVPTNNLIANNHMTQVYLTGAAWSIYIRGMGDRFLNNLVHDAPGQVILPGGPLSLYDRNEVFNTGYVEGDGGVMYIGASLTNGYGMHYRENFIHHSFEVPGLHGRGGIYFDDHMSTISNASHNILYKAAGRSFLVNGGAGNNITNNLIMNGGQGIFQQAYDDMTKDLPLYDNGTLKRGDKGDYIYKTESALGVDNYEALFTTNLSRRFPTFARMLSVNSTTAGWASAKDSNFRANIFVNNSVGNICFSKGFGDGSLICDEALDKNSVHGEPMKSFINSDGSLEGDFTWFPGAADLELVNKSLGIDSNHAGLQCDEWRRSMPMKSLFRPWVKAFFEEVPSTASGDYTPEAAALRASMRSGMALTQNFTQPCPPLTKTDCVGVWLDWGECMSEKTKLRRFTIETEVAAGGIECDRLDGDVEAFSC